MSNIACDQHDACEQGPCKKPGGHELEWIAGGLLRCKICDVIEKMQWFFSIPCGKD